MNALCPSRLGCLLACLIAATAAAVPAPAPSSPPTQPTRIRVVTDNNYPPYLFLDADGKPQGYEVDMWHLFEDHTGIKVDLMPMGWSAAQQTLLEGKADVIDMIARTPEREALYDFSSSYASSPVGIYVDRGIHGVTDVNSLRGFPVGIERGDACAERLRSLGVTDQHLFASNLELLHATTHDDLRIFCMDTSAAAYYLYRNAELGRFHLAFVLDNDHLHQAVRKGNTAMLQVVERGMAEITPAEQKTLRRRWLDEPVILWPYLRKAGVVLAAVLAAFALMALWVWSLRRTVAKRTRDLQAGEAKLRTLFDASPDAMTVKDNDGVYVDCNDSAVKRLGTTRDKIIGHTLVDVFGPETARQLQAQDEEVLSLGRPVTYPDPYFPWNDDAPLHYEMVKVPLRTADGRPNGLLTIARNVTERRHTESELRLAAAAFESQEPMLVTDADAVIQRANDAMLRLTGYSAAELVGQPTTMLRSSEHDADFYRKVREHIRATGSWRGELWLQGKDGDPKPVRLMISRVTNPDGEVTHYISSMIDLTIERAARASVDHMTFFDPLTDLPNRYFVRGRLQHLLDASNSSDGGALLMIDLDHFKRVNDLRGHAVGDKLLLQVAQRLRSVLDERCVLGRLGGGTFVLLEGCRADDCGSVPEQAWACARRVRLALQQPFQASADTPLALTASIGWTPLVPGHGSPDSVLKEAELALYSAKAAGRDQIHQFDPAMQADLLQQEALVRDLRNAIEDDSLSLHLQAQTNRAGRIIGAEALLRWNRIHGEPVSPGIFIPVAEQNGLILPLGNWVLEHACTLLASWSRKSSTHELSLSVNVSAKQFAEAEFVDGVCRVLETTGADPARLKLEITETAILGDLEEIAGKLARLRKLGIEVALDDFGIGYSSMTYLARLPLDQLKIDQSFVSRLPSGTNDAMVTQTIVAMGHGLGMQVLAEGVETQAQMDFLMAHGCDAFQGYLIARPMPAAAFATMLEERTTTA